MKNFVAIILLRSVYLCIFLYKNFLLGHDI